MVSNTFRFQVLWVVLPTFIFGFGTSELNPLQRAIACPDPVTSTTAALANCIPLTTTQFGYITAAFTVGGFLGSLGLSFGLLQLTSRSALLLSSCCNLLGGLIQAVAAAWPILALGRLAMGIGSGIALVIVPAYLNAISPPSWQGSIGVLNQLSIVIGILTAQALGVSRLGDRPAPNDRFAPWRWVPLLSSLIALVPLLLAPFALESPADVEDNEQGQRIRDRLGQTADHGARTDEVREPLLEQDDRHGGRTNHHSGPQQAPSTWSLLLQAFSPGSSPLQKGIRLVLFTQMGQQLSGVNAVLYFSTGILTEVFNGGGGGGADNDRLARWIGLGVTGINFLMTFPPIPLIDERRWGRKRLLQISSGTMALSAGVLALSISNGWAWPAALSIFLFTAGFSAGLGPIPFLILPELVPPTAVRAASSLGIACNWIANISLATFFLPLKQALGANVFYIFLTIDLVILLVITRYYRYAPPSA